jgi:glycosyltransferase involved in cell wall biosynthesis
MGNLADQRDLADDVATGTREAPSKPLRVAMVMGHFGGGGAERVAWNLAIGLRQHGHHAECMALRQAGGFDGDSSGVPVRSLGIPSGARALLSLRRLRRTLLDGEFDLLWVHGPTSLIACDAAMPVRGRRPRLWFSWHDSESVLGGRGAKQAILLRALRRCETVLGSSRSVVDRLQQATGLGGEVSVFRNGVPELPETTGRAADVPVILWAARLVPTKDPQILLRAAAKLKARGLRFRIVLAGSAAPHLAWYERQTRDLAAELGVADCVEFAGWVEDMAGLYADAAIGVQTSHTEGLSMTLLEQMMAGLAVVATDVGDTAEAVNDGRGILIPPRHEAALTDALARVIGYANERDRLGRSARQAALKHFSLAAMNEQVMRLMDCQTEIV